MPDVSTHAQSRQAMFNRSDRIILGGALLTLIAASVPRYVPTEPVAAFLCSAKARP